MPSVLVETRERVAAKRAEIAAIFAAHPDDPLALSESEVESIGQKNKELADLSEKLVGKDGQGGLEALEKLRLDAAADADGERDARQKGPRLPTGSAAAPNASEEDKLAAKSLGDLFVESPAFKDYDQVQRRGPTAEIDLEKAYGRFIATHGPEAALRFKATLDEATGFAPQAIRIPTIITPGEQENRIAALLPQGQTSQIAIPYMEETTTTNNAAERNEGAVAVESALAFTEKSSTVRSIATFLPVTNEMFADVPTMRSYVENRLRTFLAQREDTELLNGNGVAPNLRGLLNAVGILNQAKGADPTFDAVYKAITKIAITSYLDASGIVMHPTDWQTIRLTRTNEGIYILGNPAAPGPKQIWGLPVVTTTRIAQGTALVGAFRDAAQIFRRSEVNFAVSDSHSDFFQKGILALRVEERLALVVFRATGLCTVTGL